MYFGSVRFFKHLIVVLIVIAFGALATFSVLTLIDNNKNKDELEKASEEKAALSSLVEYYSGSKELSVDEIYEIAGKMGITDEQLVTFIYEKDTAAFAKVISKWNESTLPDNSADTDEETAPEQTQAAVAVTTTGENEPQEIEYIDDTDTVYLTFDDGPSEYTEKILEILDSFNIKATFFISPKDTEESFNLMNKIAEAGHTIGVYTASHDYDAIYSSADAYVDDFNNAHELIERATGIDCKYFRFPAGSKNDYNEAVRDEIIAKMTELGYVYYDWNVDSEDVLGANWTTMYNNVLSGIAGQNRAVILFHDGIYNTTLVLEDIINALSVDARGYKFKPIADNVRPLQF